MTTAAASPPPFAFDDLAGGDGDRDAGPARQPECPDSPGRHIPVMPREVVDALAPQRGGLFVDATVGLGGHAELILEASDRSRLIGIDRDAESLGHARARLARFGDRALLLHGDYRNLHALLRGAGVEPSGGLAGLIADMGISSYQLAAEGRGFSFQRDEPLDMRMDRSSGITAAELLSREREQEIARILFEYGEERRSRRIAHAVVDRRRREPVRTTGDLARLVQRATGGRRSRIHPATRTFQALRIAVNRELEGIDAFVLDSVEALQARGRLALLTFHSLEDRHVKHCLHRLSHRCSCPSSFPRCACGTPDLVALLSRRPLRPSPEEVAANPRCRSAKLRAAQRV